MKSFMVSGASPEDFVKRVAEALSGRELGKIASLALEDGELVISFSRMGTTELHYRVTEEGDGFRAELASENVAPFHAPFRDTFEEKLAEVLRQVGATTG